MTTPIPEPSAIPILGHAHHLDMNFPLGSFTHIADQLGEIFRLRLGRTTRVVLCSNALVNEACDEKRFQKDPLDNQVLMQVRNGVHDGLFTANINEPNWGIAHRILMPAFGPMSIKNMFPEMHDVASQLALKWARFGSSTPISVSEDFTRLTLDILALCAMDFRFNSYYAEKMHPFISAMGDFLTECGNRALRPNIMTMLMRGKGNKYEEDIELMRKTARDVLDHRKANPTEQKDLLNAMLNGVDPKTGQKMSDESVVDNLITFLIAGHETTSGLLSFAFYELLKNPKEFQKAQEEVDRVVGTGEIKVEHLSQLPYISAILRETLRLCSPIPIYSVCPLKDELLGGKYEVRAGEVTVLLLSRAHLDPVVFGDDAKEFKPERMLDENFDRLNREFPNCWKPFGNGIRACIGRPFAWQEALLVMAMLLQNFNFVMHDPAYELQLKQTLTIKPGGFFMRAVLRDRLTPTMLEHRLAGTVPDLKLGAMHLSDKKVVNNGDKGKPMSIFYGSNSGTCESMAQRLASDAPSHGFYAKTIDALDVAKENLPRDHPVVIVTASYEGQPPDNASHFVNWIETLKGKNALEGVKYAVYGCGHHDWVQTFHRIPKLVDSVLEQLGAERIAPIGLTDAAAGDMFTDFESWEDDVFWQSVADKYGVEAGEAEPALQTSISVKVSTPRSSTLRQDVKEATVVEARTLTTPGEPVKKHLEVKLPDGLTYSAGDYLAVLPLNPQESVQRAMRRFHLPRDAHIEIHASSGRSSLLPIGVPVPAHDILSSYVELGQPATRRNVLTLALAATSTSVKSALTELAGDKYPDQISTKRVSVLDLLEAHSDDAIDIPLGTFLSMLPPMRVRQYSISSSPLWNPHHATLTYSVLDVPALAGSGRHPRHQGVASSYLASLETGDTLHVAVRPAHAAFHPTTDVSGTPMIMISAGAGIAPFRGFIQERAALAGAGRNLAPAVLFHGCRRPGKDDLYAEELAKWEAVGAVSVKRVFSREPEASHGCKYVQDSLWVDREEVKKLWDYGAKVFVCGNRGVGESVRDAVVRIVMEDGGGKVKGDGTGVTVEEVREWYEKLRNVRFATDVFD